MQTKIRLTFLVFCLCSFMLQGQTIVQQKSYTQNLDLFVGIWEYTNGAEVFKVLLKKVNQDTSISYGECLIGDYYYSINGVILDNFIETNIPLSYNETTRKNTIIYATNGKSKVEYIEPLKLRVRFIDKRLIKFSGGGFIEFISPTQIRWIMKDDEGTYDESKFINGYSIPTSVIMTKK